MAADPTLNSLTNVLLALVPPNSPEANALATAKQTIELAADANAWQNAVTQYRTTADQIVTTVLNSKFGMLPGLADILPVLMRELNDIQSPIPLGPAQLSLNMPSAQLSGPGVSNLIDRVGFFPPTGLGLSFGAGPAKGGGFLDYLPPPNERLSGGFGMSLGVAQVNALAVLNRAGATFSLITLLSARFAVGIQLGFGFAITGIGGLVAINRAVDVNALRVQFTNGGLVDALFGDDPIRNASTVLNTLASVFAMRSGSHIFGPTLQITWLKIASGSFFRFDLGVFVQLPDPARVDIIGSARAEVPAILLLRLDVRGELNFGEKQIEFHAALVNSHILQVFRLSGTAAFQANYGDRAFVVMTLGGFYPGFNLEPARLPPQQRLGLSLDVPLPIYLRAEAYFAVTSSTLQFGGSFEAGIGTDDFGAKGHLTLDAIVQLSPFHFEAGFSAGFEIEAFDVTLYGIDCSGTISGPGPLVIHAHLSFEPIPFVEIDWSDTFTIGDSAPPEPGVDSLRQALEPELTNLTNLRAENGEDRFVAISRDAAKRGNLTLLSPLGALVWAQKRAPLDLILKRFEGVLLKGEQGAQINISPNQQIVRDRFNPGSYRQLSDAERMNQPPFDWLIAGYRFTFDTKTSGSAPHPMQFDEHYRPPRDQPAIGLFRPIHSALLTSLSGKWGGPEVKDTSPMIGLKEEMWTVGAGGARVQTDSQTAAHVDAKRTGSIALPALDTVALGVNV